LNHLFPLLKDLRSLFRQKVDLPLNAFKNREITFSAGICVAHYKEPLSLVLQEAQPLKSFSLST
jgi:CRISPR-associated protein Cmr2